jgi:putative nucleotidyltransferase with HDIG domain
VEKVTRERSLFIENVLLKEEAKKNEKIKKINKELKQKIKEVETMNLILKQLDRATTSRDLFSILVNLSAKITMCDESHFYVFGHEMSNPAVIASFIRDNNKDNRGTLNVDKSIIKKVGNDGVPLIIKKNGVNHSTMAIPLKIKSMVFGVLVSLMKDDKRNFNEKDLYFLNFLAEDASFLVENLALYENIYGNLFSTLYAFVETIEARDPYTKQHSSRVKNYAVLIAEAMECTQENIDILSVSGNLHDIGKIGIPDNVLLKPGKLTDEEYEIIKKHPVIGANIIGHFNMWTEEQKVIKHHHERWDGNGYPDMLKGEDIPLLSRILAVADTFDALTSDRSYRHKLEDSKATQIIRENSGSQFDSNIVDAFLGLREQGKIFS